MSSYTDRVKENKESFRIQQDFEKIDQIASKGKIIIEKDGQTFPYRDEQGTLLLFEDQNVPGLNINRLDQLITVDFQTEVFDIEETKKVIDVEIRELKREKTIDEKLQEFFRLYEGLLPNVPVMGETGSLQFLIRRGSEQQTGENFDPVVFETMTSGSFGNWIQQLLNFQSSVDGLTNTSASLVSLTNSLRRQLEAMGELVLLANVSGSQGVSLQQLIDRLEGIVFKDDRTKLPDTTVNVPLLVDTVRTNAVRLSRDNVPNVEVEYTIFMIHNMILTPIENNKLMTPFTIQVPVSGLDGMVFSTSLTLSDKNVGAFGGWYKNDEEYGYGYNITIGNESLTPSATMSIGFDMTDGVVNFDPSW